MSMLRVLICDDDVVNRKVNQIYVESFLQSRNITADCMTVSDLREIQDESVLRKIELAVLDIDLKGSPLNGIEIANKVKKLNPFLVVIFITRYENYALDAFRTYACGYLLKPYSEKDFNATMQNALVQINGIRATKRNKRTVKFQNGNVVLKEKDIISIERQPDSKEVKVVMNMGTELYYDSIVKVKERLSDSFLKVNRSVIVNMAFIDKIRNDVVILTNRNVYSIPARKKEEIVQTYEKYANSVW